MKRLSEVKIDDAKYYETVWTEEALGSHWHYDAVRQRALARHVRPGHKVIGVDLIPHGYRHTTSRECQDWSYEGSREYLEYVLFLGFTRGFKAPGWQISDGMYEALVEFDFWVADQAYNNSRRPPVLKTYLLDQPGKIHGHIGHLGGHNDNELSCIWDSIIQLRDEFKFIKEIL